MLEYSMVSDELQIKASKMGLPVDIITDRILLECNDLPLG